MQSDQTPQSARSNLGANKNEDFLQSLKRKYSGRQNHAAVQSKPMAQTIGIPKMMAVTNNSPLKQKYLIQH